MKRITLNYQHTPTQEPTRYKVAEDNGNTIVVVCSWGELMTLTKQQDGTYINENRVVYVPVKADTRPKPYGIRYSAPDGRMSKRFATLAELQAYVKGQWQGVDYMDCDESFHTDYARFELMNCLLSDLGSRAGEAGTDEFYEWVWKAL